jgi:hypothetical protein
MPWSVNRHQIEVVKMKVDLSAVRATQGGMKLVNGTASSPARERIHRNEPLTLPAEGRRSVQEQEVQATDCDQTVGRNMGDNTSLGRLLQTSLQSNQLQLLLLKYAVISELLSKRSRTVGNIGTGSTEIRPCTINKCVESENTVDVPARIIIPYHMHQHRGEFLIQLTNCGST